MGGEPASEGVSPFVRGVRSAYTVVAWGYFFAILVQVFLAGMFVFGNSAFREIHVEFGYFLFLPPIVLVVLVLLAKVPRSMLAITLLVFGVYFLQSSLPTFQGSAPTVAALHAANALVLFWITGFAALRSRAFVPPPLGTAG